MADSSFKSTAKIVLMLAGDFIKQSKEKLNPLAKAIAWLKEGLAYFSQLGEQQRKLEVREFNRRPEEIRKQSSEAPAWQAPSEPPRPN